MSQPLVKSVALHPDASSGTGRPWEGSFDESGRAGLSSYEVKLSLTAVRAFKELTPDVRKRVRQALERPALNAGSAGHIGGKSVKTIQGAGDAFHRLRVGDHRIMYDVIEGVSESFWSSGSSTAATSSDGSATADRYVAGAL